MLIYSTKWNNLLANHFILSNEIERLIQQQKPIFLSDSLTRYAGVIDPKEK